MPARVKIWLGRRVLAVDGSLPASRGLNRFHGQENGPRVALCHFGQDRLKTRALAKRS